MDSRRYLRKPEWLRVSLPRDSAYGATRKILDELHLNTVCSSAKCPNIFECFSQGTGTFLILGQNCTRACRFCNIHSGDPEPLDMHEPDHVAEAVNRLGLRHAVITSVTRDDLPDGGAEHFARVVKAVRENCPGVTVEVLIPDFQGSLVSLEQVVAAGPAVINHNVETVPRLYPKVRPQADFDRSLTLLRRVKEHAGIKVKSGLMVGLGETDPEVRATLSSLAGQGCDIVTIGQYLQPSRNHLDVQRYVHPDLFRKYAETGRGLGIPKMFCGPLIRSSYHAEDHV
ncbi:MAG: lipoyl synthase [Desulfovibrionales bacterium]